MSQILLLLAQSGHPTTSDTSTDWAQLIPEEPTVAWPWTISKVAYSVDSSTSPEHQRPIGSGGPALSESTSPLLHAWELLPRVLDATLVHINGPYTRAGEVALLAAKALGKRTVLSDLGRRTSYIGLSFEITNLADCLICQSETEAELYSSHARVELLDLSSKESWGALSRIYAGLVDLEARPV